MKPALVPALLAIALVASSRTARAQARAPRDEARTHFTHALELADEARWYDAIRELQAAEQLDATPAVYFNLGLAYRAVGRDRDAIAAFAAFARDPGGDTARVPEAQGFAAALRARLAHVELRTDPPDASAGVDGEPATAPGGDVLELDPGRHVVSFEAARHHGATRTVALAPGERATLAVRLAPLDNAARLAVEANVPDAAIVLDGRLLTTGRVDEHVLPGPHALDVRANGFAGFHRELVMLPGTTTRLRVVLADRRGLAAQPWFWTVLGASALGLAGGGLALYRAVTAEPPLYGAAGHVVETR